MKILTGFINKNTPEFNEMISNMRVSFEKVGHFVEVHSFPTEDPWLLKYPDLYRAVCWKYKLPFILEQLNNTEENIAWVDGDCLAISKLNEEEIFDGCDIALTLRDIEDRIDSKRPEYDGLINTGVMFFKNNVVSRFFLQEAINKLMYCVFDQDAINEVVLMRSRMRSHGERVDICGGKLKILNCRDYNFFYFEDGIAQKTPKIVHFKGMKRILYDEWLKNWSKTDGNDAR